ncbi:unnamed protein product [Amoebophrya sp. A120]|nr:unnamed protein product [Amoebophrya sp. A120]|eukprot:GSA120T00017510001.1
MKCSEAVGLQGLCSWPKKTFWQVEAVPMVPPSPGPQTVFPRYPRSKAARLAHLRNQSLWDSGRQIVGLAGEENLVDVSAPGAPATSRANKDAGRGPQGEHDRRSPARPILELLKLLYGKYFVKNPTANLGNKLEKQDAASVSSFVDIKDLYELPRVSRLTMNRIPIGLDATQIEEPNIYTIQECDPRGRIPTAVQGKWCIADMVDQTDVNGPEGDPSVSASLMMRLSNDVGERRFAAADKEYPLNNICLPKLPSDFCHFSKHRDYLPGQWRHAFAKMPKLWWDIPLPYPKFFTSPQDAPSTTPFGHGQMLHDKARLLAGSVDPIFPMHKRTEENSLVRPVEHTLHELKLGLRHKDGTDDVESVDMRYHTRAPHLRINKMQSRVGGAGSDAAPPDALLKFWVANPDSMYVSDGIVRNYALKFAKTLDHSNILSKMRSPTYARVATGATKVWTPPNLVLDEGEDCCADGCAEHVGKPFCVTEAEIRRYFDQVDHIPPPDLINCAASDSQICDSLHGDARDTDDHWGLGWLDAMRRWNQPFGPMPPREQLQQEKMSVQLQTPGDIDIQALKRKEFSTLLRPPKKPEPPPDYVPPDYDATANTSSYAVFSVTGQPIPFDQPAGYRVQPMAEDLTYSVQRNRDNHGWKFEL